MRKGGERPRAVLDKTKRILLISVTVLMCVVAALTLFVYVRSLLPVTKIVVLGVTQYDSAEVIGYSGVNRGDKLYRLDVRELESTLLEKCPYFEKVSVERSFPSKLVIRAVEKIPQWYIEVSGNYYSLDTNFLVIEESYSNEKFLNLGIPQLVLPNVKSLVCGELPEFGEDQNEIKRAIELIFTVQASTLKRRMTLVDIESRFDINVVIDGKYEVYLGDNSNIGEKLVAVEKILNSGSLNDYAGAQIDASIPETVNVRRVYEQKDPDFAQQSRDFLIFTCFQRSRGRNDSYPCNRPQCSRKNCFSLSRRSSYRDSRCTFCRFFSLL